MSMSSQAPPPMSWQDQLLDVLRARERMWFVAALVLILLGALLALLAPGTLPPTLVVGLAVGTAAVLLATALVVGLDASDLVVRGPRHVAAAGGAVAGTISRSTSDIDALVELIDAHSHDGKVRVALTPASRSAGVPGSRAHIVAGELAARGAKVLVTDLTRGGTPAVGLSDVIAGDRKLGEAVRFDDELYLAHLAVGSEPELALDGFASWAQGLPPDLDVLVAALPPLSEPGVLPAVQGVELVLLLVEVDRTERVDLIASLDAIDAADVPAELVLVDENVGQAAPTASGSVEVLSTPGSAPRQRDPEAFVLEDQPGDAADADRPTDQDAGGTAPDTDSPGEATGGRLAERLAERGADTTAAEATGSSAGAGSGAAAGSTAAGAAAAGAMGAGAAAAGAMGAGAAGADAATSAAGTDADRRDLDRRHDAGPDETSERRSAIDPADFDDDDAPPLTEPGGGHVRTVRRRPAAPYPDATAALRTDPGATAATDPDATMAMPPVDADDSPDEPAPDEPAADEPAARSDDRAADEPAARSDDRAAPAPSLDPDGDVLDGPRSAADPSRPHQEVADADSSDDAAHDDADLAMPPDRTGSFAGADHTQPLTTAADETGSSVMADDEPAWPDRDVDEPAAPVASTPDATPHHDHADENGGDEGGEDDEPIDLVAREQARLSASLQQLAQDVWQRGDE